MNRQLIVGVMGGGNSSATDMEMAYSLGSFIAEQNWILLNGGRPVGIMEASAKGAFDHGGLTIGILPGENNNNISDYIKIPVKTGMGNARNCINVLSSDIIVACPGSAGTISEIALALKSNKYVICLNHNPGTIFKKYSNNGKLKFAKTPKETIEIIIKIIDSGLLH